MSYISDAARGVCAGLDRCFAGHDVRRVVSTTVSHPMDDVAIVDFSITAHDFELYGSLTVVMNVIDWSGICFISRVSSMSKRWLKHGPIKVEASEVVRELIAACSDEGCFDFVVPPTESTVYGFRFDLAVA